jgi:hypothetical protein
VCQQCLNASSRIPAAQPTKIPARMRRAAPVLTGVRPRVTALPSIIVGGRRKRRQTAAVESADSNGAQAQAILVNLVNCSIIIQVQITITIQNAWRLLLLQQVPKATI